MPQTFRVRFTRTKLLSRVPSAFRREVVSAKLKAPLIMIFPSAPTWMELTAPFNASGVKVGSKVPSGR